MVPPTSWTKPGVTGVPTSPQEIETVKSAAVAPGLASTNVPIATPSKGCCSVAKIGTPAPAVKAASATVANSVVLPLPPMLSVTITVIVNGPPSSA